MTVLAAELGLTEGVVLALIGGVFSLGVQKISSREVRGSTRDQTIEQRDLLLWQTLKDDNAVLRKENADLRLEVRTLEQRIDGLERRLT